MASFFEKKSIPKPTAIINSAYFVTLKAMIWAVMVVPMFAPKMMETDCERLIKPADTNPTSNTVVTDEDWMIAVVTVPVSTPKKRFLDKAARINFIFSPAAFFKPSLISSIP